MKIINKKTIILGITSGIAAYKSLELIELLKKENLDVFVIMTKSASLMVSPSEFEKASGNEVAIELFKDKFNYKDVLKSRRVEHIALADKADLMVICPATANIIAKLTYGIADDFLTTTALALTKPLIICPSMNVNMWNNHSVVENLAKLKSQRVQIIEPTEGMLACGYEGKGRLENISVIEQEIIRQLNHTDSLKGKKIIITSGGTQEKIDEVRFIINKSSGKMGVALAEECFLRGADVLLLRANSSVKPRYLIKEVTFDTAEELEQLINKYVPECDIIFHTAAVSDFKLEDKIQGKLDSKKAVNLKLIPAGKIIDQIKKLNPKIKLIAFKAEYGLNENDLMKSAKQKIKASHADAIIANEIGKPYRGFQSDTNEVVIVLKNGKTKKIDLNTKQNIASSIIDYICI
ncbi:MAG TPA: bifunctional phosphopantothenoylcysteine decarboxylase/phosphopantothenate--cysteine ligase CoaBC [Candidatus Saccharimonadales bacterium]|nr:bifunctional phosphopantothenoylcysteine decarboxylase/phosphopantothenate--cysteine ligase CoaBC [Candidatus Saccharimonadales bacterium]